ncbi:MAG: hypothetical protein K6G49_01500 [Candidatus Saccharibacteria bacterium]|nr:hypothetical protein [Candidatus Saccharibacteria bacterium]
MKNQKQKGHLLGWLGLLVLIVVGLSIFLNREWLYDFYRGTIYRPTDEMIRIRSDLALTDRGEFLFNASQPELNEAAEFNSYCRNGASEVAVLGCYIGNSIHVYNITDKRLAGIRELTSAHELLHANWARMSQEERIALVEPLTRVFEANQDLLKDELNTYETDQKQEELYVRAGTEIADLPEALEKHYSEIFKDQDKIVKFYNNYIGVFKTLATEMEGLKTEMEAISTEIESKIAIYDQKSKELDAAVDDFNSCARMINCFGTEYEFNARRTELMTEQTVLQTMYDEINALVETYNEKVKIYNSDVTETEKLNTIINSSAKPRAIE